MKPIKNPFAVGVRQPIRRLVTATAGLLLFLCLPPLAAIAQQPKPPHTPAAGPNAPFLDYGKIAREGIWMGVLEFLKTFWWMIVIAVFIVIVRARVDAAIENRSRQNRGRRTRR